MVSEEGRGQILYCPSHGNVINWVPENNHIDNVKNKYEFLLIREHANVCN